MNPAGIPSAGVPALPPVISRIESKRSGRLAGGYGWQQGHVLSKASAQGDGHTASSNASARIPAKPRCSRPSKTGYPPRRRVRKRRFRKPDLPHSPAFRGRTGLATRGPPTSHRAPWSAPVSPPFPGHGGASDSARPRYAATKRGSLLGHRGENRRATSASTAASSRAVSQSGNGPRSACTILCPIVQRFSTLRGSSMRNSLTGVEISCPQGIPELPELDGSAGRGAPAVGGGRFSTAAGRKARHCGEKNERCNA